VDVRQLAQRVLDRQLYKVAATATGEWSRMQMGAEVVMATMDQISEQCAGGRGAVLLDVPRKVSLFPLDARICTEHAGVVPLASLTDTFPLAAIRPQLEASTSKARLFVRDGLPTVVVEQVLAAVTEQIPGTETWEWRVEK
jgi:hypothetical protein